MYLNKKGVKEEMIEVKRTGFWSKVPSKKLDH